MLQTLIQNQLEFLHNSKYMEKLKVHSKVNFLVVSTMFFTLQLLCSRKTFSLIHIYVYITENICISSFKVHLPHTLST